MDEACRKIQGFADARDLHNFYDALKRVYGPRDRSFAPLRTPDGTLLTGKSEIQVRLKEQYSAILNTKNPSNFNCFHDVHSCDTIHSLSEPPTLQEVTKATNNLKHIKSPGPDGIPTELLKYGGLALNTELHTLMKSVWDSEEVPQRWKVSKITSIYIKKGDKAAFGNSRGISLLAVAGKVLARVILTRLNEYIVDRVCPESQCGLRKERGNTDMIFVVRLLLEKCREQQMDLCMLFIDLAKAFDTANRDMLLHTLPKFECPRNYVKIIKAFHSGMMSFILVAGEEPQPLTVEVGV